MPINRILIKAQVATYANVLLEAARNKGNIFEVNSQLEQALHTIRGNMNLRDALADTTTPAEVRANIVKEIFKDFDPALIKALALMAEREFIDHLSRVCEAYTLAAEEATDFDSMLKSQILISFTSEAVSTEILAHFNSPL